MNKFWLKSKTTWGALLILAPTVAQIFGYDMSAEVVERLNTNLADLVQTIGVILGLFGIRMADGKLSFKASLVRKGD